MRVLLKLFVKITKTLEKKERKEGNRIEIPYNFLRRNSTENLQHTQNNCLVEMAARIPITMRDRKLFLHNRGIEDWNT